MQLYDDVAKEEMAKMAQRQGRDRNRNSLTNVKGRHGGGGRLQQDQSQKSKSPVRCPNHYTTTSSVTGSIKHDGWETVVGKSGKGKKGAVSNQ